MLGYTAGAPSALIFPQQHIPHLLRRFGTAIFQPLLQDAVKAVFEEYDVIIQLRIVFGAGSRGKRVQEQVVGIFVQTQLEIEIIQFLIGLDVLKNLQKMVFTEGLPKILLDNAGNIRLQPQMDGISQSVNIAIVGIKGTAIDLRILTNIGYFDLGDVAYRQ